MTTNLINAYTQFANKAKTRGIRAYGATITPFGGNRYYTVARETARQTVNAWFRTNTVFDGVIDFDAIVRDPLTLTNLLPSYDTGDHLHLNPTGYKAMADAIDLNLFRRARISSNDRWRFTKGDSTNNTVALRCDWAEIQTIRRVFAAHLWQHEGLSPDKTGLT